MTGVSTAHIKQQLGKEDSHAPTSVVESFEQLSVGLQRDLQDAVPKHVRDTGLSGIRYHLHSQGGGVKGVYFVPTPKLS